MMLFVGLMVAFYCDVYHKDFQIYNKHTNWLYTANHV